MVLGIAPPSREAAALESIGGAGAAWSAAAMQLVGPLDACRASVVFAATPSNVDLELGRDTR